MEQLTELEKAVLTFGYYNDVKHFEKLYDLCHSSKSKSQKSKTSLVSVWKNSQKAQTYLNYLKSQDAKRIEIKVKEELKSKSKDQSNNGNDLLTDFTNISEFIDYLNGKANTLTDEKERQKYLQMLSDLLRFKESDGTDKEIQRFYTPLNCVNCPLYQREKDSL